MRRALALASVLLALAGCLAAQVGVTPAGGGSTPVQTYTLCSGGPFVTPAATTENTLVTCTVPGGRMGATGWLQVHHFWEFKDGSGNSTPGQKSVRLRWGPSAQQLLGTNMGGATFYGHLLHLMNTGATNAQFSTGDNQPYSSGGNFGGYARYTVDTSTDQPITLTCQKATASENCTLVYYAVQLVLQ